jgi:hypothetical protein
MPLTPKKAAINATKKSSIKMKKCNVCKKEFPLTKEYFPIDKSKSSGFKSPCKWCHRKNSKTYYEHVVKPKNNVKKQTTTMEWDELGQF